MKTKRNLIQTCLLGAVLLQAATSGAQPVTISTSTLIDVGDTTYEGKDIIVTGCTLTVNGSHAFNSLQVISTALVTHSPAAAGQTNNRVNLTIAQDALIDSTSGIDASFKGYNADYPGPGAGVTGTVSGESGAVAVVMLTSPVYTPLARFAALKASANGAGCELDVVPEIEFSCNQVPVLVLLA